MAEREIKRWVTIHGARVPIYEDGSIGPERKSEEQMKQELEEHFKKVDSVLERFEDGKLGFALDDSEEAKELGIDTHIERLTKKEIVDTYIKTLNDNLKRDGDIFSEYDEDQMMAIMYNDGKVIHVDPQNWDSSKRIPTVGINSVIVDSGWGSAFAGKNVEVFNMRETVNYGKYGYKDVKDRYYDEDDIRLDFRSK